MSFVARPGNSPTWADDLPEGWTADWVKWSVAFASTKPTDEDTEKLPYISNEDIASWTGKMLKEAPEPADKEGRVFQRDDVLFNKLRPYLAKVYHADFDGISSGELLNLRSSDRVLPRFLFHALSSSAFIDTINAETFGTKMPRADWETVGHQPLPLPDLDTQRRIAGYLDDKTARIDALIEKKRALLDRLAEKRQALITRAVTRGLNPYIPLKDSGIDWLGKVPAHWEVKPLKFVGDVLQGMTYSPDDVVDEGEGWLVVRASNIQDGRLVHADDVFVSFDATPPNICREGDIIICSRNGSRHLIGKCATVHGEWVGQTFGAFMTAVRSEFGSWLSLVLASQIFEHQSGMFMSSTINQLTNSTLKNLVVPLPPRAEQEEISAGIIPRIEQLYVAQDAVRNSIEKLTEYRAALVTAAVTGKIEALLVAGHKESAAPMQAIQAH